MIKQICLVLIVALAMCADFDDKKMEFIDQEGQNSVFFSYLKPFTDNDNDPEYLKFRVELNLKDSLIGNRAVTMVCIPFYGDSPNEIAEVNDAWAMQFWCSSPVGCNGYTTSTFLYLSTVKNEANTTHIHPGHGFPVEFGDVFWVASSNEKSYATIARPELSNMTHIITDVAMGKNDAILSKIPLQNAPVSGTKCYIDFVGFLFSNMMTKDLDLTKPDWKELDFRYTN